MINAKERVGEHLDDFETAYNKSASLITNVIMTVVLLFAFSSLIQNRIESINKMLVVISSVLLVLNIISKQVKIGEILLLIYSMGIMIFDFVVCDFHLIHLNMAFYFPYLIFFSLFCMKNKDSVISFFKEKRVIADFVIIVWTALIFVTLFMPSSYVIENGYRSFKSISDTTLRVAPSALIIFCAALIQYILHGNKWYFITFAVAAASMFLGCMRTYIVVLLCSLSVLIYCMLNDKKKFLYILLPVLLVCLVIVTVSPIMEKFTMADEESEKTFWAVFTNGRTDFWYYDIRAIFEKDIFNILFGNGSNMIFEVNGYYLLDEIWAHNDFIQITADFGFLGLFVYLGVMYSLIHKFLHNKKIGLVVKIIIIFMWLFNAFFNMFYTYFCSMVAFPLFLFAVNIDLEKREYLESIKSFNNQ